MVRKSETLIIQDLNIESIRNDRVRLINNFLNIFKNKNVLIIRR